MLVSETQMCCRNLEQKQVTTWEDPSCPKHAPEECRPHLVGVRDSFQVRFPRTPHRLLPIVNSIVSRRL